MEAKTLNQKLIQLMIKYSIESDDDQRLKRLSAAYSALRRNAILHCKLFYSLIDIEHTLPVVDVVSFRKYCSHHLFKGEQKETTRLPLDTKFFVSCPESIIDMLTDEQYEDLLPYEEQRVWDTEKVFYSVDEWHEDLGQCLFFKLDAGEPPEVTSPITSNWDNDYFTHFMRLPTALTLSSAYRDACIKSGIQTSA